MPSRLNWENPFLFSSDGKINEVADACAAPRQAKARKRIIIIKDRTVRARSQVESIHTPYIFHFSAENSIAICHWFFVFVVCSEWSALFVVRCIPTEFFHQNIFKVLVNVLAWSAHHNILLPESFCSFHTRYLTSGQLKRCVLCAVEWLVNPVNE